MGLDQEQVQDFMDMKKKKDPLAFHICLFLHMGGFSVMGWSDKVYLNHQKHSQAPINKGPQYSRIPTQPPTLKRQNRGWGFKKYIFKVLSSRRKSKKGVY